MYTAFESAKFQVWLFTDLLKRHPEHTDRKMLLVESKIRLLEASPEPLTAEGYVSSEQERYQLALEHVRIMEQFVVESTSETRTAREQSLLEARAELTKLSPI